MASLLPSGWTQHSLGSRTFYYHAATNTTRQDPPGTGSFEMIANDTAMYPEPASAPQPPPASMPVAQAIVPSPPQQASPLPPALQLQPGVYCHPQPQPVATSIQPPAPAAQPAAQPMVQLQVLVPEPGLRAGQQLAFTAPASSPGMQPQQMTVTVNQEVVPGSIVTVQYPGPRATAATPNAVPQPTPALPQTTVQVDPEEDRRQSIIMWCLYGSGILCSCCFTPFALLLWVVTGAIYFCKPAQQRAQYRQARAPAYTAAITMACCCCMGLLMIPAVVMSPDFQDHLQHAVKDAHQHHGHGWVQMLHHMKGKDGDHHHHPPCPLKNWLKATFGSHKPEASRGGDKGYGKHTEKDLWNKDNIDRWMGTPKKEGQKQPAKDDFIVL